MSPPTVNSQKTTVNRFLILFLIGPTTLTPFFLFGLLLVEGNFLGFGLSVFLLPVVVAAALFFKFLREKRISAVKPRWLEYLLAGVGALYPPVLLTIFLWIFWWVLYGVGSLFTDSEPFGAHYDFASTAYGLLSIVFAIYVVRLNWNHVIDQLYPQVGGQSAFAQISATGKSWLIKRTFLLFIAFIVGLFIVFMIGGNYFSVGVQNTIGDYFLLGLFLLVIYLFFLTISAWLWLRKPAMSRGIAITNEVITRLLKPLGYETHTLAELITDPNQSVVISDQMTASIDLVAKKEGGSMVIDVMTHGESLAMPDWIAASEFRMASWYLEKVLALPPPAQAVFVLVDVVADESLLTFAEDHDIKVIQLSGEEVVELLAPGIGEQTLAKTASKLFSTSSANVNNKLSSMEPVLGSGGRNG